jgi:hypothetical protein
MGKAQHAVERPAAEQHASVADHTLQDVTLAGCGIAVGCQAPQSDLILLTREATERGLWNRAQRRYAHELVK